ncbi:hypothetical protein VNO80_01421 [Phaseolus coccineus]|uniref:Uncharacterized protein n=1 Tax=Phaseolus coccineus TaxID=3886 RepID=A0AAN9RST6_PHACN
MAGFNATMDISLFSIIRCTLCSHIVLFLTIGKSGQTLLESFLENKVEEIFEEREKIEIKDGSTEKQNEHDLICRILKEAWLLAPLGVGYVVILFTYFVDDNYENLFRNSTVLMGGCYLLFLFGSTKYRHEQVSDESNLGKIFRICKAACGRRESDYPAYGLKKLFHAHVAKSMWSFVDSYIELMNGFGKLLLIPLVLTLSGSWFKKSMTLAT